MELAGEGSIGTGAVTAALLIFLGVYALIISERVHRTIVALFGAALMVIIGVFIGFYDQDRAIEAIDLNTIGLLVGMMIIVGVTKDTGLFQYVAIRAAKIAKGDPWKILVLFSIITAVFSALLDNVTTVLLMVPMTFVICDHLKIKPMPFLLAEIFMSNIGGTATLIGDPPNILIGSAAGLTFMDFVKHLAPAVAVMVVAVIPVFAWLFKREVVAAPEDMARICRLNERDSIENMAMLRKAVIVIALVIIGFFFHGALHLEGATIALFGAALILFLDEKNLEKALHEVEWTTIFFFVGLFVVIGGLEAVGAIKWAALKLLSVTGGELGLTTGLILWGSAIFSAFVDNIPFVATMIPLVQEMGAAIPDLQPVWWSLALGACLGGNGTLVGASANLVVAGLASRAGYPIEFKSFMKYGLLIMFITVAISQVYLWLRYL